MPRDLTVNPIDMRIVALMRSTQRWFVPPATTAAKRAAHGADAVRLVDRLLRTLLAAGLVDRPDNPLARRVLALEADLRSEAAALASWATRPDADAEQDEPEPAPVRRKAGRR